MLDDSYADYEYDYDPSFTTISFNELLVPLLVYSITFILGVVGNILILLAVTAQKQVECWSEQDACVALIRLTLR